MRNHGKWTTRISARTGSLNEMQQKRKFKRCLPDLKLMSCPMYKHCHPNFSIVWLIDRNLKSYGRFIIHFSRFDQSSDHKIIWKKNIYKKKCHLKVAWCTTIIDRLIELLWNIECKQCLNMQYLFNCRKFRSLEWIAVLTFSTMKDKMKNAL